VPHLAFPRFGILILTILTLSSPHFERIIVLSPHLSLVSCLQHTALTWGHVFYDMVNISNTRIFCSPAAVGHSISVAFATQLVVASQFFTHIRWCPGLKSRQGHRLSRRIVPDFPELLQPTPEKCLVYCKTSSFQVLSQSFMCHHASRSNPQENINTRLSSRTRDAIKWRLRVGRF
jgi:hypothetical protein